MESKEDKQWASQYLLDPLHGPAPNEETGPGTHFVVNPTSPTVSRKSTSASVQSSRSSITDRKSFNLQKPSSRTSTTAKSAYPSPPISAGPRTEKFPGMEGPRSPDYRLSSGQSSSAVATSTTGIASSAASSVGRNHRSSSLSQRFAGDKSHLPLHMLRQAEKAAQRAPHLRNGRQVGADMIDSLDNIAGRSYHHEGPYDATLMARNFSPRHAPVEAVARSNAEAIKATAPERIKDSLERHIPLDGVAATPSGMQDRNGHLYRYAEGPNMMIDGDPAGGAYKRWPGIKYLPEDIKGKGEPSYSLEKALKQHKEHGHRRIVSEGVPYGTGIEMTTPTGLDATTTNRRDGARSNTLTVPTGRPRAHRSQSNATDQVSLHAGDNGALAAGSSSGQSYSQWEAGAPKGDTNADRLRKRFGSMKVKGTDGA